MIVVLIIGISTSIAVVYIDTSETRLETEAKRLLAYIKIARDNAMITGQAIGLVVEQQSYYFALMDNGDWREMKEKPFKKIKLADNTYLRVLTSQDNIDNPDLTKQALIYFLPTGESRAFQLWIRNSKTEYEIDGDLAGKLSFRRVMSN
jgi:type II secretion system protein H